VTEGVSLKVYLESVNCILCIIIEGCGVQVGEEKWRFKFFEEKCRVSVWSGYGESKV